MWRDESQPKTLDNLRGIRVPCLDGSEFLYYPKRATLKLLSDDADTTGIEIQKNPFYPTTDQHTLTTQWLNAGSEAARFVRSFGEDKSLPTMLQLIAIEHYTEQIDKVAELLDGDLISDDDTVNRWSCCRCGTNRAWYYSSYGISSSYYFYYSFRVSVVSEFTR